MEFYQSRRQFPILGVDFLWANRLSVRVAPNRLVDNDNGNTFSLVRQPCGHITSVMLQVNLSWRNAEHTSPPAIPPPLGA